MTTGTPSTGTAVPREVVIPPPLGLPTDHVSAVAVPTADVDAAVASPSRAAAPIAIERRYRNIRRALVLELGVLATIALALVVLDIGSLAVVFGEAGAWVIVLGLAPLLPLIAFGLWLDRFEPEPPWLLARALLWGAGAAIFVAGLVNSSVAAAAGITAAAVISAPLVEEALKGLAVLWIYRNRREHINGVQDGIVYAIFVGVGFTVVEDTTYYAMALVDGTDLASVVVSRGLMTPLLHSFFTAFTAMAIAKAATVDGRTRKVLLVIAGYAVAVTLHSLWNGGVDFGTELFRVLYIPPFVIGLALVRRHRIRQRDALSNWLVLEAPSGFVTPPVLDRILARTTLGEFFAALGSSDHELHARRRMQAAAWSLAAHRETVSTRATRGFAPEPIDRAVDDRLRWILAGAVHDWQALAPLSR